MRELTATVAAPILPAARAARQRIEPAFDVRAVLHHLTGGVDLTQIDGIGAYTALKLVAEIGTDMRRWPSAQHFTSWLTLAPKNKVSGASFLSSQTQPSANRAATAFRLAAASLGRTQTALGAFYRRLAARTGKPQAVTATARKLASWCTACSEATSSIAILSRGTTRSNARGTSDSCVSARRALALPSSVTRPVRYSAVSFLGVGKGLSTEGESHSKPLLQTVPEVSSLTGLESLEHT